ncbi:MAG TPA: crotonase/enoyl-CoA hydratase family protein [Steroidobacteraceae bacterium]|nr:crotonase/enoyl-CoA hydratase family protein [Steroidobacteraceae bacterium]
MTDAVATGLVRHERDERILKITIDNPAKKNAFDPAMMAQLAEALTLLDRDPDLWVGVLCAAGEDFTAGLDMPKFFGPDATVAPLPEGSVDPFGLAKNCSKPIVTAVQGITYTVGIEMMLAGDIVVAAENCRFCQMEARRGIAPFGGAHFRYIERAGWGNAMYHLMLCDEFSAAEAYRIGFVQEVVPLGQQLERAMEIARQIARNAPLGVRATKEAGRRFIAAGEEASIAAIPVIRGRVLQSADAAEGIRSFVERRAAVFEGR